MITPYPYGTRRCSIGLYDDAVRLKVPHDRHIADMLGKNNDSQQYDRGCEITQVILYFFIPTFRWGYFLRSIRRRSC